MALIDSWRLERGVTGSKSFRGRVRSAMIVAAIDVHAEAESTANHKARIQWAKMVLQNPDHHAKLILSGVCANVTIVEAGGEATDSDIQFTVNSVLDAYTPYLEEAQPVASLEGYTGEGMASAPTRWDRFLGRA